MDMDRRYAYILGWKYRMEESIREAQLKEAEEKCRESDEKLEKTMKELGKREEELEEKRRELEKKRRESEEILRMAEREKTLEIAAKFLENGVPAEIISKSSGLSSEEVQDLASRL
jgi:aspartate-semialdehyde dehydrogenase